MLGFGWFWSHGVHGPRYATWGTHCRRSFCNNSWFAFMVECSLVHATCFALQVATECSCQSPAAYLPRLCANQKSCKKQQESFWHQGATNVALATPQAQRNGHTTINCNKKCGLQMSWVMNVYVQTMTCDNLGSSFIVLSRFRML